MVNIVGHRGAAGLAPENTLAGFEHAIDLGVDAIEFDVRATVDGTPVLLHDATLERTTGTAGRLQDLELADLRALGDRDDWYVPTLEEALTYFEDCPIELHVDIKETGVEAATIRQLEAAALAAPVIVFSSIPEVVRSIADVPFDIGYSVSEVTRESLVFATEHAVSFVLGPGRPDRPGVEWIEEHDMKAGISTVNCHSAIQRSLELKPYSVLTDRPDLALELR